MIDTIANSGAYGDSIVREDMRVSLKNQVVIMVALKLLLEGKRT
jgi:hypothetical protein